MLMYSQIFRAVFFFMGRIAVIHSHRVITRIAWDMYIFENVLRRDRVYQPLSNIRKQ